MRTRFPAHQFSCDSSHSFTLLVLLAGCSKKKPEPVGGDNKPDASPTDTTAADRARWFASLKGTNEKNRLDAVDELAAWVDSDSETVTALVELLKDKTTAGSGKTHPTQIRSTREAAARTLALAGPKGEAVLKDKGFAALREGLKDSQPAVREHTAPHHRVTWSTCQTARPT